MARLVALDAPGGPHFVEEMQRIWDAGHAVFPVDRRMPDPAKAELAHAVRVGEEVASGDALVLGTSGTTGAPKGVVLTHDAIAASAAATSLALSVDPATDRWLACLPLAHIGGLGVVLRALHSGTPLEVHDGFDAGVVGASEATLVSLVPAVLSRIDVSRFRRVLLGGSAIPQDRPANTVATYGMTETGGGVVYDGVALAGVELRVTAVGEIQIRGPMLLRSYRNGVDPKTEDGWLPTGDQGSLTDGVLSVSGRAGDMIITGGENVWPGPVEEILAAHPAIAGVAVIGRPDSEWGQRVVAIIELESGSVAPRLDELRGLVRERLPVWCAPKTVEVVPALPRTALGKIRRSALKRTTS